MDCYFRSYVVVQLYVQVFFSQRCSAITPKADITLDEWTDFVLTKRGILISTYYQRVIFTIPCKLKAVKHKNI